MTGFVVGIDFGTTNTCLSYYDCFTKQIVVIPNEHGSYTTPSVLFLSADSTESLYGESAQMLLNSNNNAIHLPNIITNLKRLIGGVKSDKTFELFMRNKLVTDEVECKFTLQYNKEARSFGISSLIMLYLRYLRQVIKSHINIETNTIEVVITVPAYFDDHQRSILKECFESVDYTVLRIINEPTAASLTYAFQQNKLSKCESEYILTFDSGGGTTDISLLHLDYAEGIYEVRNTVGDNFLGGEDITNNVVDFVLEKLKLTRSMLSAKQMNKIRGEAESAKKGLSYSTSYTINLDFGEKDYSLTLTQTQFNDINKQFFTKVQNLVYYVLDDFISKNRDFEYSLIKTIIFVGATTRIPYFKKLFGDIFRTAYINTSVDPDQSVSIGACIQGALIKGFISDADGGDALLMDIIPLSIGVETLGGIMAPIISRNNLIPVSRTQKFTNSVGYEDIISINIYQGERRFVCDNIHLGSFELKCDLFKDYDKGKITITITFEVDSDSIISATATALVEDTLITSDIQVTKERFCDTNNIQEILYYSEMNKLTDLELSNQILAKLSLLDSFKHLLSVFHENHQDNDDPFMVSSLNELFNHTFNVIESFQEYSSQEISRIQGQFEMKWHSLSFGGPIVLKDEEGLIIDYGGTTLED